MDIQREIASYLNYCEYQKKLSAKTIKAYSIDLKQFMCHLSDITGQCLTKPAVSQYFVKLHQKYTPRTVKRKVASLRAFLNHLEYEEILDINPIRKMKTKFQESKVLPKTISLKLIEQLLTTVHQEIELAKTTYGAFISLRDAAILEMLFATGMRVSELCSLRTGDINLDDGTVHIMGKGAKERIVQIGNIEVLAVLQKYRNANKYQSDFFL